MVGVFRPGATAVITGGASGIGLSLAKKCREHSMKVLVIDYNDEYLTALNKSVGKDMLAIKMDVASVESWAEVKATVTKDFGGQIDLLALNAGISPKSSWEDTESFHKIMDTNLFGVTNGIGALLPMMKQGGDGVKQSAIIITGSKQGITCPPGNPGYNASKAAVKIIAEHLSYDLQNTHISVHLLVPGWTFTGLSGGGPGSAREKPAGAWWPDQVVDYLETEISKGNFYVICPDNEVSEDTDKKRILWTAGDLVQNRPPLSRWLEEWKPRAEEWMAAHKF